MVKYVGLNKQEQLKKLQDDAQNQVLNILKSFDDNLEALTRKNTFGENALGVVAMLPTLLYRATKGGLDSVLNAFHSIYVIGANLVNDIGHVLKSENPDEVNANVQYAIGNFLITIGEGLGNMLIDASRFTNPLAVRALGGNRALINFVDKNNDLFSDLTASGIAKTANTLRASILRQNDVINMGQPDKQKYMGMMTDEEIVNSRYSDEFREHIQGSLEVKNWIKNNITDKYFANASTLGLGSVADEYTQNLWGDSKGYQTLVSSAESIGSILVSWALAKVAKQYGMSAEGAKALSSAYFAANVFGGSFEEALNNGADMQDAYTYAASNAFMETMLENIGGFDTTGASSSSTSFYEKIIKNEKWANIVGNMVEEGMEEVGSVVLGRSMSQYANPDGTIEEQSMKDFASEAMFSFIGGALSSGVLGFGQSVYINTTANSKANQVVQNFDKKVYDLGAERAVKIFKKDLNTFVETLNKKNAKGLKTNARGAEYIGKLDTEEKIRLVRTAGLQNVVLLNEETGNFEINPEVERMDENFFKNTSHGQIIDNSEYAISKGVVKKDISNDGKYNVLKTSEMNEKEKTIYDFIKDSKASFALVRGNVGAGTNAFHDGKNGVIYLNTELLENMPKKEIQERISRHEFLHHIKTVAPDMYDDLAKEMEKLIDLELNEETNTLDVIYKSEEAKRVLEPILKKAKFTTTLMHNFNTHFEDVSKSMLTAEQLKQVDANVNGSNIQDEVERQKLYNSEVQKMLTEEQKKSAFNQSVEVLSEEMLAYFIENTIQGGKFVDLISKDKTLFEKVKNIFSKEADYISQISGDNKDIEAILKRMRAKFDKATEKILKAENTLYYLTYHLFDDVKTAVLKHLDKELVAKYGVDEIMLAISETYDSDTGTIIIDGTTYKDTDVFVDMKDHTVRKHTQAPSDDEVRSKFVYDKRKHDVYAIELKKLIKEAQLNLKGLLINPKLNQNAIFELENMIETAKDILTTFKDGADLFEDEIKFIADLMLNVETEKGTEKGKGKTKSKPTIAATVNSNLIQKFVYRIKKSTSYKDIKNRAYNANINGAQLFYEHTKKDAKEIQEEIENVITTMSIALNTAGFQGQYFIKHFNRGNITEFIIESDDAYVDELVKKALDRIQNEEEKDTRSQTEIRREENTAYLNNEIDKMISFLGNDSNNIIRIDSKTTVEDLQAMKFDKDNLIVGMPAFGGKMEIDILNAALKVAPTVAIIMPITYKGSYANQNQVNKNAKLIYNEISPPLLVPTKTNKNKNSLHKVVSQVWTTADTFYPDLRLKANRPFVHNDFDSFIVNTKAQFEAYKNASEKGNFDFDFAIPFRATDINDFKKIKSFDDMKPTAKYLIIKAKDKNALNIFNLIDFAKLARTGGNVLLGFTTADLVEEYSNIAKKVKKGDIRFSKQTDNYDVVLTEEVVEYFKNSYAREDEQLDKRLKRVFHGTLFGGFMEFDGSKGEGGFYQFGNHPVNFFTDNEDVANTYTKSSRRITTLTPDEIKQILFDKFKQLANPEKVSESEYDDTFSQMARLGYYYDVEEGLGIADLYHLDEQGEYSLLAESSDIKTYQDLIDIIYRRELELQSGYRMGIYETYVNITNPLIIDGQGAYWHEIPNPDVLKNFGGTLESMRTFFNNLGAISKSGNITAIQEKLAGTRFGITEEGDKILFTRDGEVLKELSREFADSEKHSMSFYDFIISRAGKKTTNDVVRDALISNENNKTDYDGVIIKNIVDIGGINIDTEYPLSYDEALSTIYVTIKSPNQVKSVYNTNPTKNNDIRFSKQVDSDGVALTEEQVKFFKDSKVRDENGNLQVLYHGTKASNKFTVFDTSGQDIHKNKNVNWFATNKETSLTYNSITDFLDEVKTLEDVEGFLKYLFGKKFEIKDFYYKIKNAYAASSVIRKQRAIVMREFNKNVEVSDVPVDGYEKGFKVEFKKAPIFGSDTYEFVNVEGFVSDMKNNYREDLNKRFQKEKTKGLYKVYVNIKNPLIINGDKSPWNMLTLDGSDEIMDTRQIVDYAIEQGIYDGVIFKDIYDIAEWNYEYDDYIDEIPLTDVVVTLESSNQIKLTTNYNPTDNSDIRYSKNLTQLTPEEERNIIKTFGDANLKSLFVKDVKTGAFKLKSNLIRQTKRSNKVKINGTVYGANKYAINAYHNFENHNINVKAHGFKAPIEIDKLSAEHKIMYDVLSTSNLSFVMYDSGRVRTDAIGFSLRREKANVVFLNVKFLSGGNFVDTLIHEHLHEAFKAKTMDAIAFGKGLIDLLFDTSSGTIKTTAVFDAINSKYSQYGGDFYSYFKAYTKQSDYVKIRNHQEFYNLLSSNIQPDTKEYNTLNEITAQFYGTLFSDTKAVHIALQGKNSNNVMLYNIFSNLLNNPSTPQTIKTFLHNSLQGISKLFKNYLQEIEKRFPSNRAYTLAELNKFIKEFSSGEFNTRKSLIDAYIKEKAQNTRGKASVVIDNVLYIAAQFEKVIQSGSQAFTQLQEEFSNFKNDVELLLTNENALLNLTGTDMPKKIKELTDLIKEMQVIQRTTGDAFTDFARVEALRELVYDLNDLYNSYDDDVIRILGFPSRNTLTVFAQTVINELDELLNYLSNNTTYPDIGKYIKKVLSSLDNFINVLKNVNTALKSNKGLFGQITKLQKSYRESRIKNLLSAISTRVNNYMNHLLNNNTLQKRSPVNDDLEAISALYNKMVKVIKDNQFNFNNMRVELIPILAELKRMIELSERVPDDSKQNLIMHIYNLAKNFTGLTKDTTFMLSLFPDDKNFINLSASEFTKDYSESSIAKSLVEIIKAFETVYTTSFGNDQYTHDEYSRKTINQIRNIKKAMKSERLEKLAYLMTPQDYYALFKDTFPEVDFFKDMYNAYIQAAIRKDNIMAQFGDAYRDFKKKNDKLHDYSLEEIEVSGIFQMRSSDIDMISKEVQDEIDRLQDLVRASSAVVSKLKGEKKLIRQAIEEKRILIANALPHSAEKARLEKELKKLQKDLNAKNAEIKKAEADKKANEAKRDTYNRDVVFQERFHRLMGERYPDYNTGQPVKLSRGAVISLYLSIVRELEMKEIHKNGGKIAPTNHLNHLSQFYVIDNDVIKTKGWQYAKDNAAPYIILEKDIEAFKDYLESLLSDEDSRKIIEFARERLDWNYESTDEIFFAKHKTHLPKQPSYFPFRTIQSDNKRDIELKNAKAYNVGVATGFVKATTEGASTPLLIENVFDVIEKHTEMVANYSFDRFIYDFENLRVNKSSGTTFQNEITGKGSKLGTGHGFERFFETTMRNILNYKDKDETRRVRVTKKVLHATVTATMALNIPSTIKQLASIYTISRKNGLPLNSLLQNVLVSLAGGNKRLRDWLMKNNGNFNLRAQYHNIPALSLHVTPDFTYRADGVKKKIVDYLSAPVGWFDNAVLVGAFKTIYDQVKLENPSATEAEILELANERFYDVLLFGVANTSSAFRSAFSNHDNVLMQIASRFQSENIIQVSALIRRMYAISNGVIGSWRELANHLAAFLASGFFTAVVSSITASARGYEKDDSEMFDFWVNEFLWGNIVGGIPLLNNFTGMIRFDSKKGLQTGFEPRQPLLTDFYNLVDIVSSMNEKNFARKGVQALEIAGNIYGIPIRNANRIISTTSRFIKNKTANDIQAFYSYKTKQQMFNQGVKDGNKQIISRYIKEEISNNAVREEMIRLALRNPDKKLNLYVGVTSFKKQNEDGVMVEYKIPVEIKGKYSELAQKTMRKLILQANYKKLDDAGKIIALQRVINYYYNYMKEVVVNKNPKDLKAMLDMDAVIKNALKV